MGRGVTATAQTAYDAHMITLWICVVIGVIVFGAMAVAMFKFRKSKGAVPDTGFTHSTTPGDPVDRDPDPDPGR